MSIQIHRVLVCDGCELATLSVLPTVDSDNPDWQGWTPIRDETANEAIKHLCPSCSAGRVVASTEWIP